MLAVLCALLVLPSLGAGYLLDDFLHQNTLAGTVQAHGPLSPYGLFVFVDGDPASVDGMVDAGTLPWWTLESLQIKFWRPLTELTHGLDHALGPNVPVLAHAHAVMPSRIGFVPQSGNSTNQCCNADWAHGSARWYARHQCRHADPVTESALWAVCLVDS